MSASTQNNFPKLHTPCGPDSLARFAGRGTCIDLDTMLDLTAKAEVNGVKFDGVDLFLYDPHTSIDASDDDLKSSRTKFARRVCRRFSRCAGLVRRLAMGDEMKRKNGSPPCAKLAASQRNCASLASGLTASYGLIPLRA